MCHLDQLLEQQNLTLSALAEQVGVTVVNLSVLKNNRARAVRFSTLTALCDALSCQPGDLFSLRITSPPRLAADASGASAPAGTYQRRGPR